MAKITMFLCFFVVVLLVMPTSSLSRMVLEEDEGVQVRCPKVIKSCSKVVCPKPRKVCPLVRCREGFVLYQPCCACQRCCPPPS
ncbi:hypothetical protein MKW94_013620 [Papaver nudicaule]|uniref:Uncharacterized protein n=1 Tax=Papaver nudicaule TaxID=74823 RepID=A0AA41SIL8_PAPNU|nr:hypothetical protein [Papaver nudicaule]